jgi:regulator of nucleoside diphosphate kinase
MNYLKQGLGKNRFNRKDVEDLEAELKRSKLVDKEELPIDVVRLNSTVTIKDEQETSVLQVTVVTPENADIKKRKISIMSPIGTALIGFKKGEKVSWKVPAGSKTFTILDVTNQFS